MTRFSDAIDIYNEPITRPVHHISFPFPVNTPTIAPLPPPSALRSHPPTTTPTKAARTSKAATPTRSTPVKSPGSGVKRTIKLLDSDSDVDSEIEKIIALGESISRGETQIDEGLGTSHTSQVTSAVVSPTITTHNTPALALAAAPSSAPAAAPAPAPSSAPSSAVPPVFAKTRGRPKKEPVPPPSPSPPSPPAAPAAAAAKPAAAKPARGLFSFGRQVRTAPPVAPPLELVPTTSTGGEYTGVVYDHRERAAGTGAGAGVEGAVRGTLPFADIKLVKNDRICALVERKTANDLQRSLESGHLASQIEAWRQQAGAPAPVVLSEGVLGAAAGAPMGLALRSLAGGLAAAEAGDGCFVGLRSLTATDELVTSLQSGFGTIEDNFEKYPSSTPQEWLTSFLRMSCPFGVPCIENGVNACANIFKNIHILSYLIYNQHVNAQTLINLGLAADHADAVCTLVSLLPIDHSND